MDPSVSARTELDAVRIRRAELRGSLNILEIRKPELDAVLVAESIAQQLERRVAFRRAMKRAVQSALRLGAEGIKITCGGRLGGAEIARVEWYREGRVPLHTLRAHIDYAEAEALTAYGIIGMVGWTNRWFNPNDSPLSAGEIGSAFSDILLGGLVS